MASTAAPQGPLVAPTTKQLASFAQEFDRTHRTLQQQNAGAGAGAGAAASAADPAARARARKEAEAAEQRVQHELGMLEYQAQELDGALQAVTKSNIAEQTKLRQTKDALARLNANKTQTQREFSAHCRRLRGQEAGMRKAFAAGHGYTDVQQPQQQGQGYTGDEPQQQGQGGEEDQGALEEHIRQLNAQIKSMAAEEQELTEFVDRMSPLRKAFKPLGRKLAAAMGLPPFPCFNPAEEEPAATDAGAVSVASDASGAQPQQPQDVLPATSA